MDHVTLSVLGALTHDCSGWTATSADASSKGCQWKVPSKTLPSSSNAVLIEQRLEESSHIIPSCPSIGASVNEGAEQGRELRRNWRDWRTQRQRSDAVAEMTIKRRALITLVPASLALAGGAAGGTQLLDET